MDPARGSTLVMRTSRFLAPFVLLALAGCGGCAGGPPTESTGIGPNPELPPPTKSLLPVVNIAPAKGWPVGVIPIAAEGLRVVAFAEGLDHPRWLHVLPNGDVLVAETNAPPRPEDERGFKGWFAKVIMKRAGAVTQSANRITLLRDVDNDGVAEVRTAFLQNLNSPFGMALVGNDFYVANTDAILRFPYAKDQTGISVAGTKLADLPGGALNHHWTKGLIASLDGKQLYASVGSNSNIAENGMDQEVNRAAILEVDIATGSTRVYASGLRNPVGMAWEPKSRVLWTVVNERDELGNELVPDYLTSVRENGFYGWPYSYFGQHVDARVQPQQPELVAKSIAPDYAIGSHVAPLGLASSAGNQLPARFAEGMFIGEHGSWNRKPLSGYEVIFVPFNNGQPEGTPLKVLTGFVDSDGKAMGRPVGVAIDGAGALLVADDVGNVIWRVSASSP